jgi:integrase
MPRERDWRGSVFLPTGRQRLHLKVRIGGEWRKVATPFRPGQEAEAEAHLAEVREAILAREAAMGGESAPVSVRAWSKRWLETRTTSRADDDSILINHVVPVIGGMLIAEVEPRHILAMVEGWQARDRSGNRAKGAAAPRTVRNWYSTTKSMFRDAALRGLTKANPCIVTTPHLPPIEDADSEWRIGARFTKRELQVLISPHPDIEPDSTVTYAILGLADLRHGELAALRWRHVVQREPLDGLLIANSNARRRTKKGKTRIMPIHPTLAAVLAEWRLEGWATLMGRAPGNDDLILPLPLQLATGRHVSGKRPELQVGEDARRRTKDFTWKRAARHLQALGLRRRRIHDLRRTFVSLATADGADDRILEWATHGRPGDIMGAYGDADWRRLCEEVAKLQVVRLDPEREPTPIAEPTETTGGPASGHEVPPMGRRAPTGST